MRRSGGILIAVAVTILLLAAHASAQTIVPEGGRHLKGHDALTNSKDQATYSNTEPRKTDGPKITERGRGDRPPLPAIMYVTGVGACMRSGQSALITEPLIQRAF